MLTGRSRNALGLNDSIDCYRTFDGARYVAWLSNPSADRIEGYRKEGIRCRRLNRELFVHYLDVGAAADFDAKQPA